VHALANGFEKSALGWRQVNWYSPPLSRRNGNNDSQALYCVDVFETQYNDHLGLNPTQIDFHYLGMIDFDDCVNLQRRLVYESGGNSNGHITCLLCEHPSLISIGRAGSRRHIRLSNQELRRKSFQLRWIGRGGGCIGHVPGQLAIYPIVPLKTFGWSVGQYLQRLQNGLVDSLRTRGVSSYKRPGRFGLWGKSGMLASIGVAIQNWITSHGAFLNVRCSRYSQMGIEANPESLACPGDSLTMSSLLEEMESSPTMVEMAHCVANHLSKRFEANYSTWTQGHPLLLEIVRQTRERKRQAC